ncbi:hypothetical protein PSTG_06512 [Puccinia striiformis f. sp. tritici PST-78]|uniref:Uncharacterized protein n=2 Tax=Puccinia striiformis f. sp. tritici TaxID=168172 RepID=A0A0L0VM32_9BASI|nr:hypothetical protein PSTG_06512 [Puccinia striiformis f. sp. tritici PST-78]
MMRSDAFLLISIWSASLISENVGVPTYGNPFHFSGTGGGLEDVVNGGSAPRPQEGAGPNQFYHQQPVPIYGEVIDIDRSSLEGSQGRRNSRKQSRVMETGGTSGSLRSGDVPSWIPSINVPKEDKIPKHDYWTMFQNQNQDGFSAFIPEKNIHFYLEMINSKPTKYIRLSNASLTHSIRYTLHDFLSQRYIWQDTLAPGAKLNLPLLFSDKGEISIYLESLPHL